MTCWAVRATTMSWRSSVFHLNLLLPSGSCTCREVQGQEQVHVWERSPQPLLWEHPLDNLVHLKGMSPRRFLQPPCPGQQNSPPAVACAWH